MNTIIILLLLTIGSLIFLWLRRITNTEGDSYTYNHNQEKLQKEPKGNLVIAGKEYSAIKLVDGFTSNKLGVLHYKGDGFYYVTITDENVENIEFEFRLDLYFSSRIFADIDLYNRGNYSYGYYSINDSIWSLKKQGIVRKFKGLEKLFFFEFEKNKIVLFAKVDYNLTEEEDYSDKYSFEIYNFEGHQIFQKTFFNEKLKEAIYVNGKLLMMDEDDDGNGLEIFDYRENKSFFFDLIDDEGLKKSNERNYEYLEFLTPIKGSNKFGLIGQDPVPGYQGIKIIRFNDSNELELVCSIYDGEMAGGFKELAFSYSGNEFSVLQFRYPEDINILVYNINEKEPKDSLKIIETVYNQHDGDRLNSSFYFSNEKLAIVKSNKIVVYDLKKELLEIVIDRDFASPFTICENRIYYCFDRELLIYS